MLVCSAHLTGDVLLLNLATVFRWVPTLQAWRSFRFECRWRWRADLWIYYGFIGSWSSFYLVCWVIWLYGFEVSRFLGFIWLRNVTLEEEEGGGRRRKEEEGGGGWRWVTESSEEQGRFRDGWSLGRGGRGEFHLWPN